MLNLKASESCEAVQARHIVTAIEDTFFVVSFPTLLTSYEPQTTSLLSNLTDQPLINLNYNNELFSISDPQLETITQQTKELSSINSLTCYN
ncbi:18973_t:CDS:1, partial [Racocetra persica]